MPERFSEGSGRGIRTEIGLAVAILVLLGLKTFLKGEFPRPDELTIILREFGLLGIFAIGAAVVIIAGGIDLSSGSVIAFTSMSFAALMMLMGGSEGVAAAKVNSVSGGVIALALIGTLFCGVVIGTMHAWLITSVGLPPFVATLGSLVGLRSLARLLIEEANVYMGGNQAQIHINDSTLVKLGGLWWLPLVLLAVVALSVWYVLTKTVVGRHLVAMGGNEDAARLSGIRTDRVKWVAYLIAGVTGAIAGFLYSIQLTVATPETQAFGQELMAIAAAVVGGCSLAGGVGTIPGVLLGTLFLQLVIYTVADITPAQPTVFQGLIVGVLVVIAVAFNELRKAGGFRKAFFKGPLGWASVVVLSLFAGATALVMSKPDLKVMLTTIVFFGVLGLLAFRAWWERASEKN